ncbi:MAG: type II toxin-antitoxin system Phd/YefM family antitoxin [Actinomycetota bacterium]
MCYTRSISNPEREIPQRELRNDISRILKEVAQGKSLRVTVKGRPVADLVPVSEGRRFVPRADVERLLREAPLDEGFKRDVDAVLGATIEEL